MFLLSLVCNSFMLVDSLCTNLCSPYCLCNCRNCSLWLVPTLWNLYFAYPGIDHTSPIGGGRQRTQWKENKISEMNFGNKNIALIILSLYLIHKLLKKRDNNNVIGRPTNSLNDTNNSSASTSASTCGGRFEVFLSFRGDDTRKGFTDFLYTYLVSASIHTW